MARKQTGFSIFNVVIALAIIFFLAPIIFPICGCMRVDVKLKNVISDFNGITSAENIYEKEFGAIPGTDPLAGARWPGAVYGLGRTTLIGPYNNSFETPLESNSFWQHLRLAGYVAGEGLGPQSLRQPTNAFGGMIGVQMGDDAGGMVMMSSAGKADGFSGLIMCSSGIPAYVAIATDAQMDDGNGAAGKIRAQRETEPNPPIKAVLGPEDAYVQDGVSTYTVCMAF